jgi:hypothetical protein
MTDMNEIRNQLSTLRASVLGAFAFCTHRPSESTLKHLEKAIQNMQHDLDKLIQIVEKSKTEGNVNATADTNTHTT